MADPVIPGVIRTMVIMRNTNALPTDRYITTWAFKAAGAVNLAVHGSAIRNAMDAFFNTLPPGGAGPLCGHLGNQVSRAVGACSVDSYDLGTAPERIPHFETMTIGASDGAASLPAEVACCISLITTHPGPRGRGRVYIGPLNTGAVNTTPEFGESRPASGFQLDLRMAAKALRDSSILADAGLQWSVVSHADATWYPVIGGYVDNAWDTHRSRGLEASGRTAW